MPEDFDMAEKCRNQEETLNQYYEALPLAVGDLLSSCNKENCFDHVDSTPILSSESVIEIIHKARSLIFPGYFTSGRLDRVNLEYWLGSEVTALFENLSKQITWTIRHDCLRYEQPCSQCIERGHKIALLFTEALPELRSIIATDVRAALGGDPAAKSYDEIIFSYPGLFAITVYRMAHKLHQYEVPLLPRMMAEYAHSLTGIDIHPGAKIGKSFFIDHGTGVVIGETTEIGDRVRIYQGVTLGALSLPKETTDQYRNRKRHPTIEDDVIIYSNASILGDPVVGARSVIGGNVWITESVPPDTKVLLKQPELVYKGNNVKSTTGPRRLK